ncbi:pirin family protein [Thioalkalivibrio sp. ALJ1]|uniref:pirin family protein n=1 Tax=Thioalkalivibrio sp. ALJ1 TaxID=1158144 RepID=UPI00056EFDDA|nr:pirin family protein [Thioalkalivibrio sp. ALJ1]
MITLRPSAERGHALHGWLDSRHSFSFASYFDPEHMGVSDLRVLNEDQVAPGAGFGAHPHRDMEIITCVLDGAIEHRDTMDHQTRLRAGEVQVMSAGTGIRHSEFNASTTDPLHFLQIWIIPNRKGGEPRYAQKDFSGAGGIALLVSPDGRDGSLPIRQDACIHRLRLAHETTRFPADPGRVYYVQITRGELALNGQTMAAGDGATVRQEHGLEFTTDGKAEALLFDLRGG